MQYNLQARCLRTAYKVVFFLIFIMNEVLCHSQSSCLRIILGKSLKPLFTVVSEMQHHLLVKWSNVLGLDNEKN